MQNKLLIANSQSIKKYYSDGQKKRYSKFCYVLHEAHKHELHKLTMARILSQASGLF